MFRGMLGEAALLYGEAGGPKGLLREQYISWIANGLEDLGEAPAPTQVYAVKLSYSTPVAYPSGYTGAWTLSGIAFLPALSSGERGSAPIISFQHGTQMKREMAPSRFNPNIEQAIRRPLDRESDEMLLNYLECVMGASLASRGYIVVMPDYPGFGDSETIHPYVHRFLGDCVRDAVVAAVDLVESEQWCDRIEWNGRLYLTGYSEGGYATMVGAKSLSAMKTGKIPVSAAVPCDGAYDLSGTMVPRIVQGTPEINPHYMPFTFVGYDAVYGEEIFHNASPFKKRYSERIPCLFDGTHWTAQAFAALPRAGLFSRCFRACDFLDEDVLKDLGDPSSRILSAIRENDAFRGWKPDFPMLIIHCEKDEVVPVENALAAFRAFGGQESDNVELLFVQPVGFAEGIVDYHTRVFPTALLEGFSYILETEESSKAAEEASKPAARP